MTCDLFLKIHSKNELNEIIKHKYIGQYPNRNTKAK